MKLNPIFLDRLAVAVLAGIATGVFIFFGWVVIRLFMEGMWMAAMAMVGIPAFMWSVDRCVRRGL